jgi:hypothetical protein
MTTPNTHSPAGPLGSLQVTVSRPMARSSCAAVNGLKTWG